MPSVKDRLLAFIDFENVEKARFEKITGLSNGFVDKVGSTIRSRSLDKIRKSYPSLNVEWLLTGEGEMKKESTSIVSEPMVSYGEKGSESVSAISIIDRNSRSIEKMVEIADRNSRSIQQLVDSNMKLIELLHQNGIIVSDETRKGGFYDSNEDKEGQSRNTRTTQAG